MRPKLTNSPGQSIFPLAVKPQGSILIIAIWVLFLLTTFAVILGSAVRQKLMVVQQLEERDKVRYIAEAGIKRGISELKKKELLPYDALKESWSNNPDFKAVNVGAGQFSLSYDYIDNLSGEKKTRYGIVDEESKININTANLNVLVRLFELACCSDKGQELAAAIVDWRDSDSELSIPAGSAENSYYTTLKSPYEAKNANLEVMDELFLIKGFNDNCIIQKTMPYLTIYGDGRVNINTASKYVLLALGLNELTVEKILLFRCGKDKIEATEDDNIFESTSLVVPQLAAMYQLSDAEAKELSDVIGRYLTTVSHNFMIRSVVSLGSSSKMQETMCVFDRTNGKTLYWHD